MFELHCSQNDHWFQCLMLFRNYLQNRQIYSLWRVKYFACFQNPIGTDDDAAVNGKSFEARSLVKSLVVPNTNENSNARSSRRAAKSELVRDEKSSTTDSKHEGGSRSTSHSVRRVHQSAITAGQQSAGGSSGAGTTTSSSRRSSRQEAMTAGPISGGASGDRSSTRQSGTSRSHDNIIGKYRLGKTIGKGNFAKVKLAKHLPSDKDVSFDISSFSFFCC